MGPKNESWGFKNGSWVGGPNFLNSANLGRAQRGAARTAMKIIMGMPGRTPNNRTFSLFSSVFSNDLFWFRKGVFQLGRIETLTTSLDKIFQTGVPSRAPKGPILLGASPPDPPASAFGLQLVGLRPPWVPVSAGLGPNIITVFTHSPFRLPGTYEN